MTAQTTSAAAELDPRIEAMIDRAAARAAAEAVQAAFRSLGVDIRDPGAISEYHADQRWTRSAREGSTKIGLSVRTTITGSIVTALLYLIWSAIQSGTPPTP